MIESIYIIAIVKIYIGSVILYVLETGYYPWIEDGSKLADRIMCKLILCSNSLHLKNSPHLLNGCPDIYKMVLYSNAKISGSNLNFLPR